MKSTLVRKRYIGRIRGASIVILLCFIFVLGLLIGCKGPEDPLLNSLNIVNNEGSRNHPWEKVQEFLKFDDTEDESFTSVKGSKHFAEKLHNRAEYYGFKTAIVFIEFEEGEPYYLNAFETVDYGTVLVDCTGFGGVAVNTFQGIKMRRYNELDYGSASAYSQRLLLYSFELREMTFKFPGPTNWDKIAYVKEGEKIGFSGLGYSRTDITFEWYIDHVRKNGVADDWESNRSRVATFEKEFTIWFENEAPKMTLADWGNPRDDFDELLMKRAVIIDDLWKSQRRLEAINVEGYLNVWKEPTSIVASISYCW